MAIVNNQQGMRGVRPPINPFTGSVSTRPAPVVPNRGGVPPGIMDRNKGTSRRRGMPSLGQMGQGTRRRRGGRPGGQKPPPVAPPGMSAQEAPMPQEALPSQSDPFNLDWALARNMGNGGYRNGGY
jgi:hypothetical protein